jgi:hypothetical protein
MGRSFFDRRRLQWQGAGNLLLALYCIFGAGGPGGVFFGILFLALAIATWTIAFMAGWDWYKIPPDFRRGIVAVGAVVGVTMTLHLLRYILPGDMDTYTPGRLVVTD